MRTFRPFPYDDVRNALKGAKKAVVIDRNIGFGKSGIFADEIKGAIANDPDHPIIFGYVTGLGGRDITPALIREIVDEAWESDTPDEPVIWKGLNR